MSAAQDDHFLDQVRRMCGTVRLTMEDIEQYKAGISNKKKRKEAEKLIEKLMDDIS